jgi:hypothetical protein
MEPELDVSAAPGLRTDRESPTPRLCDFPHHAKQPKEARTCISSVLRSHVKIGGFMGATPDGHASHIDGKGARILPDEKNLLKS